eukprot:CAMPEP_0174370024 /NCGR_PEP_ID=MMETSP0811_2-20130205/94688_1 /TAXON_ID=73025 ORGANISM="Eutreptiella gymnastica-like, Strain CCMP1594" /NCGR_SAMPLE_ID=MMETSP0811_2 /ASSEMBLY_ACC=CAM_ASM_000667 /LENGTH=108 /DNA_ID=CAMNT_0015515055 /DNA_START=352 /DNA_END=676 /DNA_ORIENTATION=+
MEDPKSFVDEALLSEDHFHRTSTDTSSCTLPKRRDLEDTGQQLSMTSPTPTLSSSTEGCRWGWAQGGYGGGGARAGGGCGAGLAGGEIKEQMPGGVRLGTPWDKCQGW